jgi:hypothetical protein
MRLRVGPTCRLRGLVAFPLVEAEAKAALIECAPTDVLAVKISVRSSTVSE